MRQFNRKYSLTLGNAATGDGYVITDLQIQFRIVKSVNNKDKADKCKIAITNLSEDHIAYLEGDYPIGVLSCGYEGSVIQVFRGDVDEVETEKRGADRITKIEIAPKYTELTHRLMSEIVPENGTVRDAIEAVRRNINGLARGVYRGDALDTRIIYGYPLVGSPRQMLDQISSVYDLEWKIENDALYVNAPNTVIEEIRETAPTLTESTGLLEAPYFFTGTEGKSKKNKTKKTGIKFKALINPEVVPGSIVRVDYKDSSAYYRVEEVKMTGDYRGRDWYMECLGSLRASNRS